MYHSSSKILIVNGILFLCEIVSLVTMLALDIGHYTTIPGPFGCWSSTLNPKFGTGIWWTLLSFETYLCALVLGPAFTCWKSSKRSSGAQILRILIRDSFIWYFSLASCLLVNALAWTTSTAKVVVISFPMFWFISTIGGARLLLNVRAVYFSSIRHPSSTAVGPPGDPNFFDTDGTVGRFWSPGAGGGGGKDDDGDCAASISMGIWSNEDVQQNRPPSPDPPVIMLKPVPPGRRRCFRPPSPSLVSTGGEEGMASSSGLSSAGPEGKREVQQQQQRNELLASDSPKPRASSSTTAGSIRRTQDPDVELGEIQTG